MKPCVYKVAGRSRCLRPSTHVCLVEDDPPKTVTENRCEWHAKMKDVIEAWTHEEMEAKEN